MKASPPVPPAKVGRREAIDQAGWRRGRSRRRTLDRLIAATTIVHELSLMTINADDFHDVPGLSWEAWPAQ